MNCQALASSAASCPTPRRASLLWLGALGCAAYLLKAHYASASPEALRWILSPTAWLVALCTDSPWPFEAGVGHVSIRHATAIVPACAGVNFLIVALATLSVGFLDRFATLAGQLYFVALAVCAALGATLLTNTLRILLDLALRHVPLAAQHHDDSHRLLGVVVYLGAAHALYAVADRLTARPMLRGAP